MSEAVTDRLQKVMTMPTEEERVEAFKRIEYEEARIEKAIDAGLLNARGITKPKKQDKVRAVVMAALDALPYGSGAQPITKADLNFAEKLAKSLSEEWASKQ